MLAESSLDLGRKIQDRFGQTITLSLQIETWIDSQNFGPALGAMLLYVELANEINDPRMAARFAPILDQIMPSLPAEHRMALEQNPEQFRLAGIAEAAKWMQEKGVELLDPLK